MPARSTSTLCAPYMRAPVEFDPSHDLLADLGALSRDDDEIDDDARAALEDELIRRFTASPEAKDLDEIHACRFVMDLGVDYLGHTIATLGVTDLREVLFELIPRKVSIEASEARWIVEEMRAFYTFLKREFGLKQAAWMESIQGKPLPPSIPLPGLPQPASKKATKLKKDKRKAARKARKKNR